jgi:hypothetical protein
MLYNGFRSNLIFPESLVLVLDLETGRTVSLADVLVDEERLMAAARDCLPFYRSVVPAFFPSEEDFTAHFGWKGKDAPMTRPLWVVVPGGIALLAVYGSKMEERLSGSGPVISFESLVRDRALRADSPVKRLWAGVPPAAAGAPRCTSVYQHGQLVAPL